MIILHQVFILLIKIMDIQPIKTSMDQAFDYLLQEFSWLQLWRANPGIVENISFEAYPDMYQKVRDVASIVAMDSQTLKIEPWDKSVMGKMEKAIYDAGLGLAPMNQWDYLMIKIPALTQERRKELVKFCEKLWEQQKVAIRNIRQDGMKDIKKLFDEKKLSEDQKAYRESEVETLTKHAVEKIDKAVDAKSEDIMKI
jgi:ribosome recycling factor